MIGNDDAVMILTLNFMIFCQFDIVLDVVRQDGPSLTSVVRYK
ncbi:MAG: hypothetical protein AB1487_00285 [Thermodesulfobacteriota bacterium]